MTDNNIYDLPKTETISYFDEAEWNKDLTPEELRQQELLIVSYWEELKTQGKGYGPCQNSSCDCYCSAYDCICNNYARYSGGLNERGKTVKVGDKKVNVRGFQHLINTGNDYADKNGCPIETKRGELWDGNVSINISDQFSAHSVRSSAGVNTGLGGVIASGGAEYSAFRIKDCKGEANFLTGNIGGEAGIGPGGAVLGYSASADIVNMQAGGFQMNAGIDVGSGVSFGVGGVEAKVAGLGFSVGKKMGISTPLGGFSIDLEETCSIQ